MSGVRDPAFWKRFSMAVHMDEEQGQTREEELKSGDTWIARQHRKRSRRTCICCCFWAFFLAFIAAIVIVIIILLHIRDTGSTS